MKISTHLFGLVFSFGYLEVRNLTQRALFLVWLDSYKYILQTDSCHPN